MKRRLLLVAAVLLILVGIFILIRVVTSAVSPAGKGALQITSNVKAEILLDKKSVGQTPLCLCEQNQTIPQGRHEIKLIPSDKSLDPYTAKININPGVLTAVERTFLPGSLASSYVLTLEKSKSSDAQIFISSIPDGSLVSIDGQSLGATPFQDSISASEHEIEIEKTGFSKKTIRVRAVNSYRLVLDVMLGAQSDSADSEVEITPSPTISPTASPNTVTIKQTPVGFLRVRETASTAASEIGRVNPGEQYEYTLKNLPNKVDNKYC
jgi:hypothetical protein